MNVHLLEYQPVHPTTWAYLSSLLLVVLFFKFNRVWSVRNLDIGILILLAPGLLLHHFASNHVKEQNNREQKLRADAAKASALTAAGTGGAAVGGSATVAGGATISGEALEELNSERAAGAHWDALGYLWLFAACGLLLLRMLLDPTMTRRPMLEPNLSTGGLVFLSAALFVMLIANVLAGKQENLEDPRGLKQPDPVGATAAAEPGRPTGPQGPGIVWFYLLPSISTKLLAVLSQLAVVTAIVLVGYWHFDSVKMGMGAACMYLVLPYTSLMPWDGQTALLGALVSWAIVFYRKPLTAGIFLGLAMGSSYYPLFLLPLWLSFYWERGLARFLAGVLSMLLVLAVSLIFCSSSLEEYFSHFSTMFGLWYPRQENLLGVWGLVWAPVYRIPVITAFVALSVTMAPWPAQKNLGTLLSCSAAILIAVQFWHGYGGGLYMAWFLPLVLMTIFRPNLEDRVALSVLGEGWFARRRMPPRNVEQAA